MIMISNLTFPLQEIYTFDMKFHRLINIDNIKNVPLYDQLHFLQYQYKLI